MNPYYIPPSKVEAEQGEIPALPEFQRRPILKLKVDDLIFLTGEIYRIKSKRGIKQSIKIRFELYPVAGGAPIVESFFPNEWIRSYIGENS